MPAILNPTAMCPSDIFELHVQPTISESELEVFTSESPYPCSIVLRDGENPKGLRLQIKTDREDWKDYEEGSLIIGKQVLCRMLSLEPETLGTVRIEVFHT